MKRGGKIMFGLKPWKKRGGKEISRFGSELDSMADHFWDHGSMIPARFLQEKALTNAKPHKATLMAVSGEFRKSRADTSNG